MMPPLHENLRAAQRQGFFDFDGEFLPAEEKRPGVAGRPEVGAEPASADANVRVVDVPVHYVGHQGLGVLFHAPTVRQVAEKVKIGFLVKLPRSVHVETLPGFNR